MSNMPKFTIRTAALTDAETLGHIGVATFVESYTADIEGAAMMAHCTREHSKQVYQTYLNKPDTGCWLAEYEGTGAPMGYALNCTPDLPIDIGADDLELKRIYVLSRYHGQGIAVALLDAALDHARQSNRKRLLLGTYEDNHRAMAFYAKHGFEIVGTRKFNVGGKVYDDIIMAKTISD